MKKVKSPQCVLCMDPLDNRLHFSLQCSELSQIRSQYFEKFVQSCPNIKNYLEDITFLLVILLDPFSSKVPDQVKESWTNKNEAYSLTRNYFYDIHKKREKIMENIENSNKNIELDIEDTTEMIITLYEKET